MIAEVYPIVRMPRKVHVFDYEIPEELTDLKRGDVVEIPFRNTRILGIVAKINDKPFRGIVLKSIIKKDPRATFSDKELSFFESLAIELAQSVASVLFSSLPTFPKRLTFKVSPVSITGESLTIPQSESDRITRIATQLIERHHAFATVSDIRRMAAVISCYLREKPEQKCVILAPTVSDAKHLFAHLHACDPLLLTGEENQSQQFYSWKSFREKKTGVLIGTKNALFSVDPDTTTLFLVRSSHKNHGHHEQNPRFDSRSIAEMYLEQFTTNVFYLDASPRVDDLKRFSDANLITSTSNYDSTLLIDMVHEPFHKPIHATVSEKTLDAMRLSLNDRKSVLCVLNKKFRAKRLRCQTCKSDVLCVDCKNSMLIDGIVLKCVRCKTMRPIETVCVKCQTKTLVESGFGNQKITELLQEEFPEAVCCVIDKEHPELNPTATIVLATSYYLEQLFNPFHPDKFNLVVLLDADAPLYRSSYRATEDALYEFEQWRSVATANRGSFIAQTRSAPMFQEYISNPHAFLSEELSSRRSYDLPPFSRIASLHFSESDDRKADLRMSALVKEIRTAFPTMKLQKHSSHVPNEHVIEIHFVDRDTTSLLELLRTFPDDVIIDTQADSR